MRVDAARLVAARGVGGADRGGDKRGGDKNAMHCWSLLCPGATIGLRSPTRQVTVRSGWPCGCGRVPDLVAALTAIFAKIGIENVNSDFATFIRTVVILLCLGAILAATGQFQSPGTISGRTYAFLVLSGLATGASWICYFRALKIGDASQVAPIDKLSVVLVAVFAFLFLGERPSGTNGIGILLIAAGAIIIARR